MPRVKVQSTIKGLKSMAKVGYGSPVPRTGLDADYTLQVSHLNSSGNREWTLMDPLDIPAFLINLDIDALNPGHEAAWTAMCAKGMVVLHRPDSGTPWLRIRGGTFCSCRAGSASSTVTPTAAARRANSARLGVRMALRQPCTRAGSLLMMCRESASNTTGFPISRST